MSPTVEGGRQDRNTEVVKPGRGIAALRNYRLEANAGNIEEIPGHRQGRCGKQSALRKNAVHPSYDPSFSSQP